MPNKSISLKYLSAFDNKSPTMVTTLIIVRGFAPDIKILIVIFCFPSGDNLQVCVIASLTLTNTCIFRYIG